MLSDMMITSARARRILLLLILAIAAPRAASDEGVIVGRVVDADDQPVAGAMVVVCDQQTGIPVHESTSRPFTELSEKEYSDEERTHFAQALTDEQGRFVIDGVADGEYRLIAQSWPEAGGPITGALEKNGSVVILRGIVGHVRVPSDEAQHIALRPCGTASLRVDQSNCDLVIISAAPLATDPILGPLALSGEFIPQMVSASRTVGRILTVHGLPGGTVHIAAISFDNVSGFGGATAELTAGTMSHVHPLMVAAWSDGHHDPPPRLAALCDEYRARRDKLADPSVREQVPEYFALMKQKPADPRKAWTRAVPFLDRPITLADGRAIPFKDWLAVEEYVELRAYVDQRAGERREERLEEMGIDESITYEQALNDLYQVLGEQYPCFALKGIDWPAVGAAILPRAKDVADDEAFGLLCMEMVARLEDSHAHLLAGAAKLPELPLPRWDPGFACLVDDRGMPVVYYVDPGGPAEAAGIELGMTVTSIDGTSAMQAIEETMNLYRRWIGHSSERYLRYQCFRWFIRRDEQGARVRLEVEDVDGQARGFVVPATFDVRYIPRLPVPIAGISDSRSVSWKMLEDDIGYIYVRRIRDDLIASLDAAVGQMQAARGLIIDVRGNSEGGFDSQRGHLNFAFDRDGEEPDRPRFRGPIALLIDARCISAGEGWASWFIAHDRATFFGEATAGASARKTIYTLSNGLYKVRFPVKAYKGYLDRPIERRGLEPHVPIMPSAADIAAGRDTILEVAKAHLLREAGS
jgi:C-terminal processing protease CtpA/Prc